MKKKDHLYQGALTVLFVILSLIIIFPFLLMVAASVTDENALLTEGYKLFPSQLSGEAYKFVFDNPKTILRAYGVTAIFSFAAMVLGVLFMSLLAYPLTKKKLKFRNAVSFYIFFTMLFNGGLVPTFIMNTQYLHLNDTIWIYILPGLISPWYVFMLRTFFAGLPDALCESAYIDGASEFRIFFTMILPLSKPVIAAVALFIFLAKWNDWFTSLMYIENKKLISLQYFLHKLMTNIQLMADDTTGMYEKALGDMPTETTKMAMAIVVAGPALVIFPFFQKYFVKGLTVGSVKG